MTLSFERLLYGSFITNSRRLVPAMGGGSGPGSAQGFGAAGISLGHHGIPGFLQTVAAAGDGGFGPEVHGTSRGAASFAKRAYRECSFQYPQSLHPVLQWCSGALMRPVDRPRAYSAVLTRPAWTWRLFDLSFSQRFPIGWGKGNRVGRDIPERKRDPVIQPPLSRRSLKPSG